MKDVVHMQNYVYMDRFVPPYINARSVPTENISNWFVSAQYLRRINDLNLGKRCSILPTVKHVFQQHKNRLGVRVYVLSDLQKKNKEKWRMENSTFNAEETDILRFYKKKYPCLRYANIQKYNIPFHELEMKKSMQRLFYTVQARIKIDF